MKIAIAHYSSTSDISGVTTWLVEFCGRLVEAGHHVCMHLHHFGDDPQQGSILPSLQRVGIETHSVSRTGSLEADSLQTLHFLNQVRPELFLPQCLHAHYLAAAHAGQQGLPWIFTMHSDDPQYWCVAEAVTPEAHGGRSVCVSQFLAQKLSLQVPASAPQVIPCGTTIPSAHTSFSDQPFRVVYSGRMVERQKCVTQVIRSLIASCQLSARIHVDLLGDGPERSTCERMVAEADLTDRIVFLGRLTPAHVSAVLQRSQAILLMSDFEGLPIALLESMASGVVPVVRAIQSGIPELVHHEETGLLVSNDPEEAAAALVRLAEDQDLWQQCSTRARSLVSARYSADRCFALWAQLIEEHRGAERVPQAIASCDLGRTLLLSDPRFLVQYPPPPTTSRRIHPGWIASQLRRLIVAK